MSSRAYVFRNAQEREHATRIQAYCAKRYVQLRDAERFVAQDERQLAQFEREGRPLDMQLEAAHAVIRRLKEHVRLLTT